MEFINFYQVNIRTPLSGVEVVKTKIHPEIINREHNRCFLETEAYTAMPGLDLAVIYQIVFSEDQNGSISAEFGPMIFLSDHAQRYGAVQILNEQALKEAEEIFGGSFLMLP